ncbi:hypothetical protein ABIA25_000289 [Sinorhizobium fredii]|uniref:AAA family ATPase n=1 Tax=Rhizobium fredii TaxID=380 RepID=UPI003512A3DC
MGRTKDSSAQQKLQGYNDNSAKSYTGRLVAKTLSTYEIENVQWLWRGYLASGKQTYIHGWPEAGKGMVLVSVVAAITTGRKFPDGADAPKERKRVIWFSAEESASDTLMPRILNADGDPDMVEIIEAVKSPLNPKKQQHFDLQSNLRDLEELINFHGDVAAVIFDPLTAYISGQQTDKGHMREVLDPVTKMAERTGVAVIGVVHDVKVADKGKGYKRAASRMAGSSALWEIPRAAFFVHHTNPDDKDSERQFMPSKFNLPGGRPPSLGFVTTKAYVGDVQTVGIEWQGEIDAKAEATVRDLGNSGHDDAKLSKKEKAKVFLRSFLAHGPVAQTEVEAAAKDEGITAATLKRAKDELRSADTVEVYFSRSRNCWFWRLLEATEEQKSPDTLM